MAGNPFDYYRRTLCLRCGHPKNSHNTVEVVCMEPGCRDCTTFVPDIPRVTCVCGHEDYLHNGIVGPGKDGVDHGACMHKDFGTGLYDCIPCYSYRPSIGSRAIWGASVNPKEAAEPAEPAEPEEPREPSPAFTLPRTAADSCQSCEHSELMHGISSGKCMAVCKCKRYKRNTRVCDCGHFDKDHEVSQGRGAPETCHGGTVNHANLYTSNPLSTPSHGACECIKFTVTIRKPRRVTPNKKGH